MKTYKTQERNNMTLGLEISFWYNILRDPRKKENDKLGFIKIKNYTKILNFCFINTLKRGKYKSQTGRNFCKAHIMKDLYLQCSMNS